MKPQPVVLPINRTVVSEVCRWCQAQILPASDRRAHNRLADNN